MLKHKETAHSFFTGRGYLVFLGAITLAGHIFSFDVITMSLMLLSCSIGVLVADSIRPFCAVLVIFIFQCSVKNSPSMPSFSNYYFTEWRAIVLFLLAIMLLTALFIYFIRGRRISVQRIRALPYKSLSAFFSLSLLLCGVLSGEWKPESLLWGAAEVLALVLLPYLIMLGMSEYDADGIVNYLVMLAQTVALVLIIETVNLYLTGNVIIDGAAEKGRVLFGWGIWTTAGMDMAVLIPILMLGALQDIHPKFSFVIAHALYLCSLLTLSRNALLFGTLALAASAAALIKRASKRRFFGRIYLILSALIIISIPLWIGDAVRLFSDFIERGFSDNGRLELWNYGLKSFFDSFVFGKGFFALSTDTFRAENIFPPMLHNTFIQLAAATGIFGLISYVLWQSAVLTRLLLPISTERVMLFISYATLILMSLLDNFIFHIQPMFLFSVLLATAERQKNSRPDF